MLRAALANEASGLKVLGGDEAPDKLKPGVAAHSFEQQFRHGPRTGSSSFGEACRRHAPGSPTAGAWSRRSILCQEYGQS